MLLANISVWVIDLITFGIIGVGLVLGIFLGFRSLLFVTIGDGIGIGLAFAFKSLIFPQLISGFENIFNGNFKPEVSELVSYNIANSVYFLSWVLGMNILFWIIYLIFKLTFLKKHELKHKVVNRCGGAILNALRMSVVAGFFVLFMGSGIIANKTIISSKYLINDDIAQNSIAYKFFAKIDDNFPLFNIKSASLRTINNLRNEVTIIDVTSSQISNWIANPSEVTLDGANTLVNNFKQIISLDSGQQNIVTTGLDEIANNQSTQGVADISSGLKGQFTNNFEKFTFMQPILSAVTDFGNHFSKTFDIFSNQINILAKCNDYDKSGKLIPDPNLKSTLNNFINGISDKNKQTEISKALNNLYDLSK